MKVLHLFSNYKFTGPADPALQMARALTDAGAEVAFAAGRHASDADGTSVAALARQRGLDTRDRLRLPKHGKPLDLIADVRALRRWLREEPFDLIHCHLKYDHFVAVLAARRQGVPVVRTIYDAELPKGFRARVALGRSQGVFVYADTLRAELEQGYPPLAGRVHRVDPIIDLSRFQTQRDPEWRQEWGASDEDLVIGVVARMQTHRLFPELIEGFALAVDACPRLKLVVLGRGTNQEVVAHEPARQSRARDHIVFPGYIEPERYPRALPSFDGLVFLVPGSDGTCRAAREAMTCGVPVVSTQRGLLPTFVHDGETGFLLESETPRGIADGILKLANETDERQRLAAGARRYAEGHFDPAVAAQKLLRIYETIPRAS